MQPEFENWYDFGNILLNADVLLDINGVEIPTKNIKHPRDGVLKIFTKNKNLVLEITYNNNKMNGQSIQYYEDTDKFMSVDNYKNNELDGICKHYTKEGIIDRVETFKNGVKEGVEKIYNDNGSLVEESIWVHNEKAKIIKPVTPRNQNIEVEIFKENEKIGLRDIATKETVVEPLYDYDMAIKGSYYVDPEYWDNYYLYRFRDGYVIFKCGDELCVFNDKGVLIEPLTRDIKSIVEKYYYDAPTYWKCHSL